MSRVRRGLSVVLALLLAVVTAAFALRWVDVATREVAAVQAVVPVTAAAVVVLTLVALGCRFRVLALLGAVPSVAAVVLAVGSLAGAATAGEATAGEATAGEATAAEATAAGAPGAGSVGVMTVNLRHGGGNAEDVVGGVRERRVDVAVLVEVTPEAVTRLRAAGLDAALPYVVGHAEAGTTGALIRSRWPLTLLDAGRGLGGSPFWQPYALVQRPGSPFRVKAIHTRQPIVAPGPWRDDLRRIGEWQRAQPGSEPLVLAGDFNSSMGHPAFRLMAGGLVDAHRATGAGWVRTWPQGRRVPPFVQLDHVLVRGERPVDAGVVPVRGTDHAAAWARLTPQA